MEPRVDGEMSLAWLLESVGWRRGKGAEDSTKTPKHTKTTPPKKLPLSCYLQTWIPLFRNV